MLDAIEHDGQRTEFTSQGAQAAPNLQLEQQRVLSWAGSSPISSATTKVKAKTRSGNDLVYATGGCDGVCIFTYPDVTLKGKISLSFPVGGDCSDSLGNIYVTNNAQILEYAHGGTTPIATLALPGINANACGVDPKTGNLAICGFGGNSNGNVAIFDNATGNPIIYDSGLAAMYCGYDDKGNLFVSGTINLRNTLAELAYESSAFISITLNGNIGGPGQVQWDGAYITLENQREHITISRLAISGSTASLVSKTQLRGPKWATESWIVGDRVITPYSSRGGVTNKIGAWRYPRSGKIDVKFGDFGQSKLTRVLGVTLSRG
jgi:hypothetical protein